MDVVVALIVPAAEGVMLRLMMAAKKAEVVSVMGLGVGVAEEVKRVVVVVVTKGVTEGVTEGVVTEGEVLRVVGVMRVREGK